MALTPKSPEFVYKQIIEQSCPICHDVVESTDGFDPIVVRCLRCGERSYSRAFCDLMWQDKLSDEGAAFVAGHLRAHPDYEPRYPELRTLARELEASITKSSRMDVLLRHLADVHGTKPFWLHLQSREEYLPLLGLVSLPTRDGLVDLVTAMVTSGLLERRMGSSLSSRFEIAPGVWEGYLHRSPIES